MKADILPELRKRKSPLVFSHKEIEKEDIQALIEAARWAPSCFNNQSWNYVLVHKEDDTRDELEASLSKGNSWAKEAPYLVAVGADPEEDCSTNNLPYYAYDAGLSVMSLVVEAERRDLRVHQMAGWSESKVKKALGFPDQFRVVVVFALGYEADVKKIWHKLEEKMRERLSEPRKRKPPTANFFFGVFGN